MQWGITFERLFSPRADKKGIFVLLDPDKIPRKGLDVIVDSITQKNTVKALLVGTSMLFSSDMESFTKTVKENSRVPVILFPGSAMQLNSYVDAVLFLSLLSGRNSEYLVSEQVKMAPLIKTMKIETIPTAYLLVESESMTTVEFVTGTKPIPRCKPEIAAAHAITAELLGMKVIYLEAGSGAKSPVPLKMIKEVRENTELPLLVGGGLREREQIAKVFENGADYAVVGTLFEEGENWKKII